jgi:hypothetical protein
MSRPKSTPPAPTSPPPAAPPVAEAPVIVAQGDIPLPRPARRTEGGSTAAGGALSPKVRARAHGRRSPDIGGRSDAGDAFAAWLSTEKGLDPNQRFGAQQLAALTEEFKARPIHGHRRSGSAGDNHRPNPEHLRKK